MKHVNGKHLCPSCEGKLTTCHPEIVYWFRKIREAFPDAHVAWGYRNEGEQAACVRAKTSKLIYPESNHNNCVEGKPCSLAMDLFRQGDDGKYYDNIGFFVQIAHFLMDQKAPITWGGEFHHPDNPHFELKPSLMAQR